MLVVQSMPVVIEQVGFETFLNGFEVFDGRPNESKHVNANTSPLVSTDSRIAVPDPIIFVAYVDNRDGEIGYRLPEIAGFVFRTLL